MVVMRTLSKVSKTWGFCSISKNDGRRGTFEQDLQRCIFRGRRSTRDIFTRAVRRSGRWFPERGCILEHLISRFAEMILRDMCSPSYDLASLFRGRRSSLDRWTGKSQNAMARCRQRACNFPFLKDVSQNCFVFDAVKFEKWRSLAELLRFCCCQLWKNEEVSQNCFVLDVVKFQNWGSLAELLRFWSCQLWKMKKSCRIAPFLMLSSLKPEDVSQNSFVF